MKEAGESVKKGMELTDEVAAVLTQILKMNEEVADLINQVSASSEEQSTTAEEISRNIDSISSVTRESVSGTTQMAHAAEDLSRLAENLQTMISQFKLKKDPEHRSQSKQLSRVL